MKNLNWAFIGAGGMAHETAEALKLSGRNLYAVWNRTTARAEELAKKYGAKVYEDCDEMLSNKNIDIVYIATTHDNHIDFLRKALNAKKHVLCEKSITLNSSELDEAETLSQKNGVMLGEAMTIWHMPLYEKIEKIIDGGELGRIMMMTVVHGSVRDDDSNSRFFDINLGGGTLLDLGVYALAAVRRFIPYSDEDIWSNVLLSSSGVDKHENIMFMNKDGQMANLSLSLTSQMPKRAIISGEKGYIEIENHLRPDRAVVVNKKTGESREITAGDASRAIVYEIEAMEDAVRSGNSAKLCIDKTRDVMTAMTSLRRDWGVVYPTE